jgi:acyl carrier protein
MLTRADWSKQGIQLLILKIMFKLEETMRIRIPLEMLQKEKEIKQIIWSTQKIMELMEEIFNLEDQEEIKDFNNHLLKIMVIIRHLIITNIQVSRKWVAVRKVGKRTVLLS